MEHDKYYLAKLERTAAAFRKKGFEVKTFSTGNEAAAYLSAQISAQSIVGYGGSRTVTQLNILERLRGQGCLLLDRARPGISPAEKAECERKCFSADYFLASANAVAESGAIVNIDMWGNRTAAIEFGPRKVFLLIGRNKLVADIPAALQRASNTAAVLNCVRFDKKTPCTADGQCHNCASPERICSVTSIIERSAPAERICLCLINEDLGF